MTTREKLFGGISVSILLALIVGLFYLLSLLTKIKI